MTKNHNIFKIILRTRICTLYLSNFTSDAPFEQGQTNSAIISERFFWRSTSAMRNFCRQLHLTNVLESTVRTQCLKLAIMIISYLELLAYKCSSAPARTWGVIATFLTLCCEQISGKSFEFRMPAVLNCQNAFRESSAGEVDNPISLRLYNLDICFDYSKLDHELLSFGQRFCVAPAWARTFVRKQDKCVKNT